MTLTRAAVAEVVKLRGLPAVAVTTTSTILAAAGLAAALARSDPQADVAQVTVATIPYVQAGLIVLGVLAVATEYASGQIRVSLLVLPRRGVLLAGKAAGFLVAATVTAVGAVGAALATAHLSGAPRPAVTPWPPAGAAVYLVLIGLLGFALAVLLRSLVAPLAGMLTLVLIVSPLAGGLTRYARWLPDRAGSLLLQRETDPVLSPATGGLVLAGWVALLGTAAVVTFRSRDA